MNAGLLARAYTNDLSALGIANRVGLGVFEGNQRNYQIDFRLFRQILILCYDMFQHFAVDLQIVAALLKSHAVNLLVLNFSGHILRIDFDDVIGAFTLGFEKLQRFVSIARSDDPI